MQSVKNILIPTDLTEVADRAIEYGTRIANKLGYKVTLIHVMPDVPGSEEVKKMMSGQLVYRKLEESLQSQVEVIQEESGVEADYILREGSIFEQIPEAAKDLNSHMVVIGTHGKRGIQYITGSFIGKVVAGSGVPVLVVKKESHFRAPQKILIPLDFSTDPERILAAGMAFARAFKARLNFISPASSENDFAGALQNSLVDFSESTHPATGSGFIKDVFRQAAEAKDAIVIFNLASPDFRERAKRLEQILSGNGTDLPVMYVNSGI